MTYVSCQLPTFCNNVGVYIDGVLRLDIGGVHGQISGSIALDQLGLTPYTIHNLDIFHAERHYSESNFRHHLRS